MIRIQRSAPVAVPRIATEPLALRSPRAQLESTFTPVLQQQGQPARTREQALAEAQRALAAFSEPGFAAYGDPVTNPADSTTVGGYRRGSPQTADAEAVLAANAGAERAALAALTPPQQTQYLETMALLADRPGAQLAMQTMLLDGRLPGAAAWRSEGPGGNLLETLHTLAVRGVPATTGDTTDFVAQLAVECAAPECINQGDRGTCGPTSLTIALARENPSEYARVVAGLALNGSVVCANGSTLNAYSGASANDGTWRSLTQKLLAPALMSAGNTGFAYDNTNDRNWFIVGFPSGMYPGGLAAVGGMLFNRNFSAVQFLHPALSNGYASGEAFDRLAAGRTPVIAVMDIGHFMIVDRREGGFVYLTNPWGVTERMTEADFQAHCRGVVAATE